MAKACAKRSEQTKQRKKPSLKDGTILNEMPYKDGVVLFCSGRLENGERGFLFIFNGVEGYEDDHRVLLDESCTRKGETLPYYCVLHREHQLYLAHQKLDDEHEVEYYGTVPICPEWEGKGMPTPQHLPKDIYEVLSELMGGESLSIQYALGGQDDTLWGPTVDHPLNRFCAGKAIFVYQRWRVPSSLRMSEVIENPTYLDIIKFANKCVYQDYPQDHIHLEGVNKIGDERHCTEDVPVYMLQFGS